jgi:hypothetical protein
MPPENGLSGGIDVCSFSRESLTGTKIRVDRKCAWQVKLAPICLR